MALVTPALHGRTEVDAIEVVADAGRVGGGHWDVSVADVSDVGVPEILRNVNQVKSHTAPEYLAPEGSPPG